MRSIFNYYFLSERECLDRIKAEDTAAESFVVRKYESSLRKSIRKKLKDYQFRGQEEDDFCQDILLRFLIRARQRGSDLLKADQTLEQWLRGNVRNESLQAWKNQKEAREILMNYNDMETAAGLPDQLPPGHEFVIDSGFIDQALNRLDVEETRFGSKFVTQLYTYRFVYSMTWEEVTNALNEDFPDYEKFPLKKPLTWEYVSRSLWNGNYDRRLRALLKSIQD